MSLQNDRLLDETAEGLGLLSSTKVCHALAVILDLPDGEIRTALSPQSILACSGLVSVDRKDINSLRGKLDLLSDEFADLMASSDADPISLLRGTVSVVGPGHLNLTDYSHIQPSLEILHPYLRHAATTSRRGVNIFLHGAPGTGKSQLARAPSLEGRREAARPIVGVVFTQKWPEERMWEQGRSVHAALFLPAMSAGVSHEN